MKSVQVTVHKLIKSTRFSHLQRQIQDFLKGGGRGLSQVWIFHT